MEKPEYELMYRIETTYWWYTARRWLVMRILRRHLKGSSLAGLDVGCGTGGNIMALNKFSTMSGCDIAPEAVDFCRNRGLTSVVLQDRPDGLPFPDSRFDFVTGFDVMEHIENDARMLADMARVLKPNGLILLTVPAYKSLWSVHDESMHHKRRYDRADLLEKLGAAGFVPERTTHLNAFLMLLIMPVRRLLTLTKRGREMSSDFNLPLPRWLNAIFHVVFCSEWAILRFLPLPFGLSLLCVARKRQ